MEFYEFFAGIMLLMRQKLTGKNQGLGSNRFRVIPLYSSVWLLYTVKIVHLRADQLLPQFLFFGTCTSKANKAKKASFLWDIGKCFICTPISVGHRQMFYMYSHFRGT